jgi:hypothetical protein
MIVECRTEKNKWKEVYVAHFKVISQYSSAGIEGSHYKTWVSEWDIIR